jgi:hypothetical protein
MLTTLYQRHWFATNGGVISKDKLEMMWMESALAYIELLS